jgi:hypothetical protein
MATKKYRVFRTWEMSGWDEVEAESREDAELEVGAADRPLPSDGEYVSGSCKVDENFTLELNQKKGTWVEAKG